MRYVPAEIETVINLGQRVCTSGMMIEIALRLGLESTDLKLLTALVVALFLSIPYWKGKYFTKAAAKGGPANA